LEAKIIWNWPVKCDKILIDIVNTKVKPAKGSKVAGILSAQMNIRGWLFEACLQIVHQDANGNPEEDGSYALVFHSQDLIEPIIYLDTPMAPQSKSLEVFLLPICTEWQDDLDQNLHRWLAYC
jgi:hypothetical protein